jgi:hypothetical protein
MTLEQAIKSWRASFTCRTCGQLNVVKRLIAPLTDVDRGAGGRFVSSRSVELCDCQRAERRLFGELTITTASKTRVVGYNQGVI